MDWNRKFPPKGVGLRGCEHLSPGIMNGLSHGIGSISLTAATHSCESIEQLERARIFTVA